MQHWMKKFGNGETKIADKTRSGRPTSSATEANLERAGESIRGDRRVTFQNAVDALNDSHGSLLGIIANSKYHNVYAKWVPKQLEKGASQ